MRYVKLTFLLLLLFVGCQTQAAENQDDSRHIKVRELKRGKDGVYRLPNSKIEKARLAAENARKLALRAKKDYESKKSSSIQSVTKFNYRNIFIYYSVALTIFTVFLINRNKET
jgi:hypothetical protein